MVSSNAGHGLRLEQSLLPKEERRRGRAVGTAHTRSPARRRGRLGCQTPLPRRQENGTGRASAGDRGGSVATPGFSRHLLCQRLGGRGGAGRAAWSEDFHQPASISSVLPTHGSSVRFDPFPVSLQFGIRFFRRSRKMWSFSWVPCWWCWCWSSGWAGQLYFPSLFAARPRLSGDIVPIVAAKRG